MNARATSAVAFVVVGLACQEVGAALAFQLFPQAGPLGMVMLRLVFSAAILLAIARPGWRGYARADWRAVLRFGTVLAVMNACFYLALQRLDLGVAVTIEVLGPLMLSVIASRRASAWLWAALALAGVVALGGGAATGSTCSASCSRSGRRSAGRCTSWHPRGWALRFRGSTDSRSR